MCLKKPLPYYITLFFAFFALNPLRATSAPKAVSGLLLADPLAARPLAVGNAFSALADDESSINTNPAGLVRSQQWRISGTHLQDLVGTKIESLSMDYPLQSGNALGFQLAFLRDDQQRLDEFGNFVGEFNNSNLMAGLAWSSRIGQNSSFGLGIKAIQERFDQLKQVSAAADLGLQTNLGPWKLGLHTQNIGRRFSDNRNKPIDAGQNLPLRVAAGIARTALLPHWNMALQLTGMPLQNRMRLAAGTELWIGFPQARGLRLALRAGYQYDLLQTDVGRVSVGAGITAPPYLELNYALINFGLLGNSHRVSLTFTPPKLKARILLGEQLSPVYGLKVIQHSGGIVLNWRDNNRAVVGYRIYTDYGHYEEQLTSRPIQGHSQKFIKVIRDETYNFYVRPVGSDGKAGPTSEVLTWTAP